MKKISKTLAKITVMESVPKTAKDSTEQMADKMGNLLWNTTINEKVFNEKYNDFENSYNVYKSFMELEKGDHVVKLKTVSIGETKGNYTGVNTFYTITDKVDQKATIGDMFSLDGVIPPSKRKAVANKSNGPQVTQ